MRTAALGISLVAGILVVVCCSSLSRTPAMAQTAGGSGSGSLIAFSVDGNPGAQQVTLIDPRTQVMSVYHIDRASGEISLRSVRNIRWDLQLDEFNGANPSPREIQLLLQQR